MWRSKLNIPRRVLRLTIRTLIEQFNLFTVSRVVQNNLFKEIGLVREDGLVKLEGVLNDVMSKSYNENDGMFSEHLILISSISVSHANIKRVLEIGTHDGRTALILSRLFPDAEIVSIDLPIDDPSSNTPTIEIVQLTILLISGVPILQKPRMSSLEK